RRAHPCIAAQAQALVRLGMNRQAHLAGRLHAVDGGNVALGKELAPARVHEDHELRDELVERRAAPARHDAYAIVVDEETEVERREPRTGTSALLLQCERHAPERSQLLF